MKMNHVGIVCQSEENCDRFYRDLLQLEKVKSRLLMADLAQEIFQRNNDYPMLVYSNGELSIEIFLSDEKEFNQPRMSHTCLEVQGRDQFLEKCAAMQLPIRKVARGDSVIVFIEDFDQNLFEIKEQA